MLSYKIHLWPPLVMEFAFRSPGMNTSRCLSLLGPSACCPSCPSGSLFPPSAESLPAFQAFEKIGTHALGMGIPQWQISYSGHLAWCALQINVQEAGSCPNSIFLWQGKPCPLRSLAHPLQWRERPVGCKALSRQEAVSCTLWDLGSQQGGAEATRHSFSLCNHRWKYY